MRNPFRRKTPMQKSAELRERLYRLKPHKLRYIQWLLQAKKSWAKANEHDGELNSQERNRDFDMFLIYYSQKG